MRRVDGLHGSYRVDPAPLARGGVGSIHRTDDPGLVYKEYLSAAKVPSRPHLERLVAIGREVLVDRPATVGATPDTSVNWPVDIVHDRAGHTTGVILPGIPPWLRHEEFGTVRGLDFLIMRRAAPPRARSRMSVLLRLAEVLAYLDARQLVHGDLNYKNVAWALRPAPTAYLLDCDGIAPAIPPPTTGVHALGWTDPRLVEGLIAAHDQASDRYALALAMYRGLLLRPGNFTQRRPDGTWPTPGELPSTMDGRLRELLSAALDNPLDADRRPAPVRWARALAEVYVPGGGFDQRALDALDELARPAEQPRHIPLPAPHRARPPAVPPRPAPVRRTISPPSMPQPTPGRGRGRVAGVATVLALLVVIGVSVATRDRVPLGTGPVGAPPGQCVARTRAGPLPSVRRTMPDTASILLVANPGDQLVGVAFSPDGKTFVGASQSGTVRFWDASTAQPTDGTVRTDPYRNPVFSPDGRTLATVVSRTTIQLWDVARRQPLGAALTGHTGEITSVAFSPDGRLLATAAHDSTIRLWDVAQHQQLGAALTGHAKPGGGVAFSPDGRTLASAGEDFTIRLWDVAGHQQLSGVMTADAPFYQVGWSPDGQKLAVVGWDRALRLWDAFGRCQLGAPVADDRLFVHDGAFTPDGRLVATALADSTIRLWDVESHLQVGQLGKPFTDSSHRVVKVAFSPDGSMLASVGGEGLRLWYLGRYLT